MAELSRRRDGRQARANGGTRGLRRWRRVGKTENRVRWKMSLDEELRGGEFETRCWWSFFFFSLPATGWCSWKGHSPDRAQSLERMRKITTNYLKYKIIPEERCGLGLVEIIPLLSSFPKMSLKLETFDVQNPEEQMGGLPSTQRGHKKAKTEYLRDKFRWKKFTVHLPWIKRHYSVKVFRKCKN